MFNMIDETCNRANLVSQALYLYVTDVVSMFAVYSKSGRPILAKHRHANTVCERIGANSNVLLKSCGAN